MIYKFKSKAAGDVIMLGPNGDQVLRLLGREPAPQGIFDVQALPGAITTLERAVEQEDAERAAVEAKAREDGGDAAPQAISLRQRVYPLVEMMKLAQAAGEPIVWGV